MEVENCHEFENQVKEIFNKKYQRRKDIGNEYYEGNKDEMMEDYFNLKKSMKNVKTTNLKNKNPQKNILDEKQTYYYPINELEKFYEILKNSINVFNVKNNTNIKYDYKTLHILMPVYKFILNWNIINIKNESINIELQKIKDKIEEDILEFTYLKSIVELLIETDINIENISELENLLINTLLLLDGDVTLYYQKKLIEKMFDANEIKELPLKIYNNVVENKIIEDIIKIKNNLTKLNLNKNCVEYYEKINYEKRIIYSKYYKNNPSFQNFDLKMLKNIEDEIKKDVNYELIHDNDNNYFGVKYNTSLNRARFITNIINLYDIVEENLEEWIENNVYEKVYKNEYQYMIGLNIKFNPLSLINIIERSAKNKVKISIENIMEIYNNYTENLDKIIKYNIYECKVVNYFSESDTESDDDDYDYNYDELIFGINNRNTEIYNYLITHNEKKITKTIIINEMYYNKLKDKNEKILNNFLKNIKIISFNEYPISFENGICKKPMIIIYDTIKNTIKETDFYYGSSTTLQYIPNKKQINNIDEYEKFLNCVMDIKSINEFKNFAKSVLCENKNLKCQIMKPGYNIVEILLWLMYFIDYAKISINFENNTISDYKKELKFKKKIIILYVKSESDKIKAVNIMSKYNNNYVIINNTNKQIDEINIIENMTIKDIKNLKKYFNNNDNLQDYEVYDLLEKELVMLFDWINGNNNLNEYMKNNELIEL